jgi:hypothetical protein
MTAVVLAHQGGWDEILMVLVPIGIFAVLLAVANRRADTIGGQRHREGRDGGDDVDPGDRGNRRGTRPDTPREGPSPR